MVGNKIFLVLQWNSSFVDEFASRITKGYYLMLKSMQFYYHYYLNWNPAESSEEMDMEP